MVGIAIKRLIKHEAGRHCSRTLPTEAKLFQHPRRIKRRSLCIRINTIVAEIQLRQSHKCMSAVLNVCNALIVQFDLCALSQHQRERTWYMLTILSDPMIPINRRLSGVWVESTTYPIFSTLYGYFAATASSLWKNDKDRYA